MSDLGDAEGHGPEPEDPAAGPPPGTEPEAVDLDSIEQDLDGVEQALDRLADGSYGTDEITGAPIPDEVLENDPTARRA